MRLGIWLLNHIENLLFIQPHVAFIFLIPAFARFWLHESQADLEGQRLPVGQVMRVAPTGGNVRYEVESREDKPLRCWVAQPSNICQSEKATPLPIFLSIGIRLSPSVCIFIRLYPSLFVYLDLGMGMGNHGESMSGALMT